MKRRVVSIVLAAAMCMSLAACGSSSDSSNESSAADSTASEESESSSDEEVNICFVLKTTSAEVYKIIMAGAQEYADTHEGVNLDIKGASSETAYDEQMNLIETALSSGTYDAMIIHPSEPDMVTTLVSGQTIPIIDFESEFEADEVVSFVGISQQDAGKTGAEAAVELAEELGWEELNAIAIAGIQGDSNSEARVEGYQMGVEEAGGTFLEDETQYSDAVADDAVTCMEAIMQNHPEGVAMILCHNDDVAMAAARAAEGNEAYENTVFCGWDGISSACEAILNGEETMSISVDWYGCGYDAVEAAVAAARGEDVEEEIYTDVSILTEENAQEYYDTLQTYLEDVEEEEEE